MRSLLYPYHIEFILPKSYIPFLGFNAFFHPLQN